MSRNVIYLRGEGAAAPPRDPHQAFAMARKAMLAAFRDWVRTGPEVSEVAIEVNGTETAMKSIYRLEADRGA